MAIMVSSEFGLWFKRQLRLRRWTQADFSHEFHFSAAGVSRWITGERVPTPESCERIAEAFGVDVDLVLTQAGHRPAVEPIDPNDPVIGIIGLVKRVEWNDERLAGMRAALIVYQEIDRKKRESEAMPRRSAGQPAIRNGRAVRASCSRPVCHQRHLRDHHSSRSSTATIEVFNQQR
jgi:transcriptional regulator with XRE-family HTH domain